MCHASIVSATTLPTWPLLICTVYMTSLIILVFYLCNLGPFSIAYLEAQVTWNFVYKSLDRFLSSLQLTWKAFGEIPSDFGCLLGDILGRSNIVICIFYLFKSIYVTLYHMFYNISTKGGQNSLHWWIRDAMPSAATASWVAMVLHSVTSL